ncbi:hypothetical protein GPEL0_01r1527 [Geoanaerobacter pelophilus]|uniref:Uncharacterized protein n=1 Tax=Geoanaerobacter pelophilus TaxID=60036 RepID=A0ABQ0MGL4_9BACT|nr:hypothetical protein GPEL0_01r1527 [Geoanaerobacter pelophilus]
MLPETAPPPFWKGEPPPLSAHGVLSFWDVGPFLFPFHSDKR